jgi:ABC-type oligopeptide transport system substrate-binding subunit
VIWKYYGDAATMLQGYKAGEYDVARTSTTPTSRRSRASIRTSRSSTTR